MHECHSLTAACMCVYNTIMKAAASECWGKKAISKGSRSSVRERAQKGRRQEVPTNGHARNVNDLSHTTNLEMGPFSMMATMD